MDVRHCRDCGAAINRVRFPTHCPYCSEKYWAIWDAAEVNRACPDAERGIYADGFCSKAAALQQIPVIIAQMAEIGIDLSNGDFCLRPY